MKGRRGKRFASKVDAFSRSSLTTVHQELVMYAKDQNEKKLFVSSESNTFLERQ